jgi:hypothetical protein
MIHKPLLIVSVVLLSSCGGGGDDTVTTNLALAEKQITITRATVAWGSPTGTSSGQPSVCNDLFSATLSANPPPFPNNVSVPTVRMLSGGATIWSGTNDPSANFIGPNGTLSTVAPGCAPSGIQNGQEVALVYDIVSGGSTFQVMSSPTRIVRTN